MPLWARYQQCLVTTDPTELILIIDQFSARYSSRGWAYYVDQANEALVRFSDSAPTVVALLPDRTLPADSQHNRPVP